WPHARRQAADTTGFPLAAAARLLAPIVCTESAKTANRTNCPVVKNGSAEYPCPAFPSSPIKYPMSAKRLFGLLLVPLALMLGGCHKLVLLYPEGHVAQQQSDIMISTTIIIALIIVPVLIAIGVVAWRYRASNKN